MFKQLKLSVVSWQLWGAGRGWTSPPPLYHSLLPFSFTILQHSLLHFRQHSLFPSAFTAAHHHSIPSFSIHYYPSAFTTTGLLLSHNGLRSKNFLGKHAPRPPLVLHAYFMHTYTRHSGSPPSENPGYGPELIVTYWWKEKLICPSAFCHHFLSTWGVVSLEKKPKKKLVYTMVFIPVMFSLD